MAELEWRDVVIVSGLDAVLLNLLPSPSSDQAPCLFLHNIHAGVLYGSVSRFNLKLSKPISCCSSLHVSDRMCVVVFDHALHVCEGAVQWQSIVSYVTTTTFMRVLTDQQFSHTVSSVRVLMFSNSISICSLVVFDHALRVCGGVVQSQTIRSYVTTIDFVWVSEGQWLILYEVPMQGLLCTLATPHDLFAHGQQQFHNLVQ